MTHSDEEQAGEALTDEQRAQAIRAQLKSVHAFDVAYDMAISLVSFGYQKMGLTDETRELRNLDDARLAIELLRANLEVLERERGQERLRDLRSTLAQMQLGYARAVQTASHRPAGPPPAAEEPEPAASEKAAAAEPAAEESEPAASEKAAAAEPPAKKPAAKKPAAKKPAAKKPRGGATPRRPAGE
jgi:hypothetical protein